MKKGHGGLQPSLNLAKQSEMINTPSVKNTRAFSYEGYNTPPDHNIGRFLHRYTIYYFQLFRKGTWKLRAALGQPEIVQ